MSEESKWNIPEGEFCIYGTVYADPRHADEVEAIYKETTRLAQFEDGIVYYCLSRDQDDPSIFHFFERYKSKAAFDQHNQQDIIQKFIKSGWMKDVKAVFAKPITP
ncbi:uncharacterized protein A1O9_07663 [Exophiala aquamarina CBS 119918]|uniref:ABM domain-containing protein n=1 Tax=Exophiala aquamarina CBS 119918 TaxID=1182545 RepID=A0A072P8K9_9EURO|nr:uncharacterized protein A1O9_07663 [Exophiala aquamarina CBS 119918]KEF56082.1 hypothetical protein A1O9_07663 [Exophiala aquamarina CBS 119918]